MSNEVEGIRTGDYVEVVLRFKVGVGYGANCICTGAARRMDSMVLDEDYLPGMVNLATEVYVIPEPVQKRRIK